MKFWYVSFKQKIMLISRCGFSFVFKIISFIVTFLTFTDQIKLMEISCVDM
jgi:hypothetical protein